MTEVAHDVVIDALAAVYQQLTDTAGSLTETQMMLPTRCAGWAVSDVLYHQLLDARRALRAFATPGEGPPDRDDTSYWSAFSPAAAGADEAAHARHVRIVASAYPPGALVWEWAETAAAACRAARTCRAEAVSTQGHVLRTPDFIATLAVEAAVHLLDLSLCLPAPPAPDPLALSLVRRVLSGLLGTPLPPAWDDVTSALKGTGREPLSEGDRDELGEAAARFPLFG
ncbi:MAG TPA: maleylpyruvate isomerase N-terminal domain-containing protein [Streptosporangiaceae bacterium]|nr:maleylpyruvate isomerase N-terminal domain-containing protein [Streptosporangiaceae bacterium]